MKIQRMKTNRIVNPLGFDLKTPHVSWTVTDTEAKKQLWARVEVSKTEDFADVIFDTGACKNASSLGVPVEIALEPRTRYFWRVTVMGDNGELVTSDTAWFETAKLDEPFTAQRISPCLAPDTAPYMRRAFEITGEVLSARAYFTGLGIYELYLNGEKANDEYLAPGCTAYDSWIQYQTYDVTDLIHTGENVIGAILGNGWAKGRFGFDGVVGDYETNFPGKPCNMYTEEYLLFGELHVTTTQGETVIVTDESWQCAPNPLTFGNIYDGERYDANLEIENWCAPSCTYANWQPVKRNTTTNLGAISARLSLPVKAKHIITPKQITTPKNELVFDLGQNITGWFTFMADLPAGVELRVQTGELLQDDCFYRDNLRTALSEYRYISTGKKAFIRPIATFYGFRYIKFSGVADLTGITDIQAWAMYSDLEQTGEITTANEKVNRLYLNSVWSQRDNFLDVPTDCPQRDERLGWLNDLTVRAEEAMFNFEMDSFYRKFVTDMLDAQGKKTGAITDTVPYVRYGSQPADPVCSSFLLLPWMLYQQYGDKQTLRSAYPGLRAWTMYLTRQREDGIVCYSYYGDWASPVGGSVRGSYGSGAVSSITPGRLISTGYLYLNCMLLAQMADVLMLEEDHAYFRELAAQTCSALNRAFLNREGGFYAGNSQAANTFMLYLGVVPEQFRAQVLQNLIRDIQQHDTHVTTGNLCTRYILDVLADNGEIDLAYALVTQTTYPSWGYMLACGATTVWERWEYVDSGELVGMASHDHPMYAAVSGWFYRCLAGLRPDAPAFSRFTLQPYFPRELPEIRCTLHTVKGEIRVEWTQRGGEVRLLVRIPFNASAVWKPTLTLRRLLIDGAPAPDAAEYPLGAGTHSIEFERNDQ